MKIFTTKLLLLIFLSTGGIVSAQESAVESSEKPKKVKPVRIGAKIGFPNLIGGNVEFVTPLLGHRLALAGDYSSLSNKSIDRWVELDGEEFSWSYLEGGLNFYLFKPGRGLYAGLSYGVLKGDFSVEEESYEFPGETERTRTQFTHDSFNLKLGAKWGGTVYFRPEIGYSFTKLPEEFEVDVYLPDGSRESRIEELSISKYNKGLLFNLGLGLAF